MAYHLLTGATGLLGRYLLRDLTLAEIPLAVVVRRARRDSALQRIETAMVHWERELGRALLRPVVLEGDISQPLLGLSDADAQWVCGHVSTMIHSAASLTFYAEEADGEPWRSNIQGTRHVLELCRQAGIKQFHHVSTAYVCGARREKILETELDVGQQLGNDYEISKLTSETEVLQSGLFDSVTVHRPSIIVGDARTGFTTSFHGFYTPLRLTHSLLKSVSVEALVANDWLGGMELDGNEHKNLVPVDWVSAAMTEIIARPELHGKTYHLTNPQPATVADMAMSIAEALGKLAYEQQLSAESDQHAKPFAAPTVEMIESFREQMKVYQSYWKNDPDFDSTNTETALPHLPCPRVDRAMMDQLIDYAVRTNFGWPREMTVTPEFAVETQLGNLLSAGRRLSGLNGHARYVNLEVSGRGGGQWRLVFDHDKLVGALTGVCDEALTTCYMSSGTLEHLMRGEMTGEQAIHAGRLVVAGAPQDAGELDCLFRELN